MRATSNSWKAVLMAKPDPVRPADELDHEHDFPDERQARPRGGGEIGRELRRHDVARRVTGIEAEGLPHFVERRIERARALAQGDDGVRQLVDRHGADRPPPR